MDKPICIFQAGNIIEANLVKGLLLGEGIAVLLQGEHLTGAIGELPPTGLTIDLWIPQIKLTAAMAVIEYYKRQQSVADAGRDWICAHCGEHNSRSFEICWQCQREPKRAK